MRVQTHRLGLQGCAVFFRQCTALIQISALQVLSFTLTHTSRTGGSRHVRLRVQMHAVQWLSDYAGGTRRRTVVVVVVVGVGGGVVLGVVVVVVELCAEKQLLVLDDVCCGRC